MNALDDMVAFFGDVHEHAARIYVRCPPPDNADHWRLTGTVSGPNSPSGNTLPATWSLQFRPGETLLADAVIGDPCFWSLGQPLIYRVQVRLHKAEGPALAEHEQSIGIRPLGAADGSFYWAGQRRVLRIITLQADAGEEDWRQCVERGATVWTHTLQQDVVEFAERLGVPLLLDGRAQDVAEVFRSANRSPAVIAVLVDVESLRSAVVSRANQLLVADLRGVTDVEDALSSADAILIDEQVASSDRSELSPAARIAVRTCELVGDAARTEVDRLQRDLAPRGQFAGYAVLPPR